MTLRSGTGQACASCKFQRRRCTTQCLLAPFFPADQPHIFQSVHRLFGVKHIQKLLKELHPDQRAAAMESVKFHAAMREKFPVHGCLVQVHNLNYQIQTAQQELHSVLQQLFHHRQQQQQQQQQQHEHESLHGDNDYLSLGMANQDYNIASSCSNNINGGDYYIKECNDFESLWMQSQMHMNEQQQSVQDCYEMCPFSDNVDDKQSYIGPKDVSESSLESSVRDSRLSEQVEENELKNAAACFSLTSFN